MTKEELITLHYKAGLQYRELERRIEMLEIVEDLEGKFKNTIEIFDSIHGLAVKVSRGNLMPPRTLSFKNPEEDPMEEVEAVKTALINLFKKLAE